VGGGAAPRVSCPVDPSPPTLAPRALGTETHTLMNSAIARNEDRSSVRRAYVFARSWRAGSEMSLAPQDTSCSGSASSGCAGLGVGAVRVPPGGWWDADRASGEPRGGRASLCRLLKPRQGHTGGIRVARRHDGETESARDAPTAGHHRRTTRPGQAAAPRGPNDSTRRQPKPRAPVRPGRCHRCIGAGARLSARSPEGLMWPRSGVGQNGRITAADSGAAEGRGRTRAAATRTKLGVSGR